MTDECVFCRMIDGTLPVNPVYEDEHVLAFDDISPQAPVHTLVVPKVHVVDLAQGAAAGVNGPLFSAVPKVARLKGVAESGYRVTVNNGHDARQTVPHLHVHVMGGRPMAHGMVTFAGD